MVHGEDWVLVSGRVGDFARGEERTSILSPAFSFQGKSFLYFELVFAFSILSLIFRVENLAS